METSEKIPLAEHAIELAYESTSLVLLLVLLLLLVVAEQEGERLAHFDGRLVYRGSSYCPCPGPAEIRSRARPCLLLL